jgi:hypothetical protein
VQEEPPSPTAAEEDFINEFTKLLFPLPVVPIINTFNALSTL